MKTNNNEFESYVSRKLKEKADTPDERQMQQTSTAMSIAVVFGMLFDVVMMAIYFIRHDTDKAYPYLAQLLVICAGFGIAMLGNKEPGVPKTLSGRSVPTEKTGKAFALRLLNCFIEAASLSVVIMLFNVYDKGSFTGTLITETIISFAIFMAIEVAFCEFRVHRYRKAQAKLDQEENDLED